MKGAIAALLLVAVAPHLPLLTGGCLTDDFVHLGALAANADARAVLQSPDAFGFYRPIQQLTYLIDGRLGGFECGVHFRFVNLALHAAVVLLAFAVATRVAGSLRAGFVAALILALAPKAPTIAVFWISARAELLVALFAMLTALAWRRWLIGGHRIWLLTAAACYAAALLGKEAAALLPFVLLLMPGGTRPIKPRVIATMVVFAGALVVAVLRFQAGATFAAVQNQYQPDLSPLRWAENLWNYFARSVPAPAVVSIAVAIAVGLRAHLPPPALWRSTRGIVAFGVAWYVALIAAALPIVLRSEIRLYLPGFGIALIAAALVDRMVDPNRRLLIPLLLASLALGGYQMMRSIEARRDAQFSASFVRVLANDPALRAAPSPVAIVPANREVEQQLRDTVGGYGKSVIAGVLQRVDVSADIYWLGQPVPAEALTLVCTMRDDAVRLERSSPR